MLILGEIHTGLLMNSGAVPAPTAERILDFVAGAPVWRSERPIQRAVSPDRFTGVDCPIITPSTSAPRVVGTVASHAVLVGGHVLQGSTFVQVQQSRVDRRLPWSHYLAQPGVIETIGKVRPAQLAEGFPNGVTTSTGLDLGAISRRGMDAVQSGIGLDFEPPFKMWRTAVKWSASLTTDNSVPDQLAFRVENETTRTIQLRGQAMDVQRIVTFCEDLALHDWLLTALVTLTERTRIGVRPPAQAVATLKPAVDHLLHLWMPSVRIGQPLAGLWEHLEREAGFSRQWQALVQRIRDYLAVTSLALLSQPAAVRTEHS